MLLLQIFLIFIPQYLGVVGNMESLYEFALSNNISKDGIAREVPNVGNHRHCASMCLVEPSCRGFGYDEEKTCYLLDVYMPSDYCEKENCLEKEGIKVFMPKQDLTTTTTEVPTTTTTTEPTTTTTTESTTTEKTTTTTTTEAPTTTTTTKPTTTTTTEPTTTTTTAKPTTTTTTEPTTTTTTTKPTTTSTTEPITTTTTKPTTTTTTTTTTTAPTTTTTAKTTTTTTKPTTTTTVQTTTGAAEIVIVDCMGETDAFQGFEAETTFFNGKVKNIICHKKPDDFYSGTKVTKMYTADTNANCDSGTVVTDIAFTVLKGVLLEFAVTCREVKKDYVKLGGVKNVNTEGATKADCGDKHTMFTLKPLSSTAADGSFIYDFVMTCQELQDPQVSSGALGG